MTAEKMLCIKCRHMRHGFAMITNVPDVCEAAPSTYSYVYGREIEATCAETNTDGECQYYEPAQSGENVSWSSEVKEK